MKRVFETLAAGFGVYVVMAACSSGGRGPGGSSGFSGAETGNGGASAGGASAGRAPNGEASTGGVSNDAGANPIMDMVDAALNPVPDVHANESGSRLNARWNVGEDGSRQFIGWRDTLRNIDCSFQVASDETLRCLPAQPPAAPGWYTFPGLSTFYTDVTCLTAVSAAAKRTVACGALPPVPTRGWITADINPADTTCGSEHVTYALAARAAPSALYLKSGNNCVDLTASVANYEYYNTSDRELVTPTPTAFDPTLYVQATEMVDP